MIEEIQHKMEMKGFMVSFILIGAFTIAVIMFGMKFGQENATPINIINNSEVYSLYSDTNDTIYKYGQKGVQDISSDVKNNTINEEDPSTGTFISDFVLSSIKALFGAITGIGSAIFEVTWDPLLKLLGLPLDVRILVGTVVTTILMFIISLLIWKLVKQGQ
jgi:hypothetical protein